MKHDIQSQLADYRGVFGWNAFTDRKGVARPAVEVPLFIKEHSIPIRRRKMTEITLGGAPMVASTGVWDNEVAVTFDGAPDPLQIDLSGWIITPVSNKQWAPVDISGSLLNIGNVSYADIVTMYLDGRMNPSFGGYLLRKDPDYYISPHGSSYPNPTLITWEPSYASVQKKQPFTCSMVMET